MHSDAFKLSSQRNTFRVGDGDVYDSNVKQPVLSGQEDGNELSSGDSQLYEGKSNNMWVEFKTPDAGALKIGVFKIEYSISMSGSYYYLKFLDLFYKGSVPYSHF